MTLIPLSRLTKKRREFLENLAPHALAKLLPAYTEKEKLDLRQSLKTVGQLHEGVVCDDLLLVGVHRLEQCLDLGMNFLFREIRKDENPIAIVLAEDLYRRHMIPSQRAMVVAELCDRAPGYQGGTGTRAGSLTQEEAASAAGVSERSVRSAVTTIKKGAPELVDAVKSGGISVSAASQIAELPKDEQREIVENLDPGVVEKKAKEIRRVKRTKRRGERIQKAAHRAKSPAMEGFKRRYGVVIADPSWFYELEPDAADYGGASQHYPPMTEDEIKALPVGKISAKDSVLALWCPGTVLADGQARRVAMAWDFKPVTTIAWDKYPDDGPRCRSRGYWTRQDAEFVMLCKRGDIPCPEPDRRIPSPIRALHSGKHSDKPTDMADYLEEAFPTLHWVELFSRRPRPGWACWGNETGLQLPDAKERAAAVRRAKKGRPKVIVSGVYTVQVEVSQVDRAGKVLGSPVKAADMVENILGSLEALPDNAIPDHDHARLACYVDAEKVEGAGQAISLLLDVIEDNPRSNQAKLQHRARFVRDSADADRMERAGLRRHPAGGVSFRDFGDGAQRCARCLGLLTHNTEGDLHKKCQKAEAKEAKDAAEKRESEEWDRKDKEDRKKSRRGPPGDAPTELNYYAVSDHAGKKAKFFFIESYRVEDPGKDPGECGSQEIGFLHLDKNGKDWWIGRCGFGGKDGPVDSPAEAIRYLQTTFPEVKGDEAWKKASRPGAKLPGKWRGTCETCCKQLMTLGENRGKHPPGETPTEICECDMDQEDPPAPTPGKRAKRTTRAKG